MVMRSAMAVQIQLNKGLIFYSYFLAYDQGLTSLPLQYLTTYTWYLAYDILITNRPIFL